MPTPFLSPPSFVALCLGVLSGIASNLMIAPVAALDFSSLFGGLANDRLGIQITLALAAGLPFGLIGASYLRRRAKAGWKGITTFFALSVIGMFCAAEVAIQVFFMTGDRNGANFIPAYLVASLVGAGLLMAGTVLTSRLDNARSMMLHGLIWPTLAATATAIAMATVGTDDALTVPWSYMLFCGWQGAFLMVLSRARPRA